MPLLLLLSLLAWIGFPIGVVWLVRRASPRGIAAAWGVIVFTISTVVFTSMLFSGADPIWEIALSWTMVLTLIGIFVLPTGASAYVAWRRSRGAASRSMAKEVLVSVAVFLACLVPGAVIATIPDILRLMRG